MIRTCRTNNFRRALSGAALVAALVILIVLTLLGMAVINMSTMEERMSFNSQDRYLVKYLSESVTLYAADDGELFPYPNTQPGEVSGPFVVTDAEVPGVRNTFVYKSYTGRTSSKNLPSPPGPAQHISTGSGSDDPFVYQIYVNVETEAGTSATVRTNYVNRAPAIRN